MKNKNIFYFWRNIIHFCDISSSEKRWFSVFLQNEDEDDDEDGEWRVCFDCEKYSCSPPQMAFFRGGMSISHQTLMGHERSLSPSLCLCRDVPHPPLSENLHSSRHATQKTTTQDLMGRLAWLRRNGIAFVMKWYLSFRQMPFTCWTTSQVKCFKRNANKSSVSLSLRSSEPLKYQSIKTRH